MEKPWAKAVLDVEKELDTSLREGLVYSQFKERLKKDGRNAFNFDKPTSALKILWRQCGNFFVLILLLASLIAFLFEGLGQAVVLWVIITLNITLGFIQENKAEKTLETLKNSLKKRAKVIRHHQEEMILADELVVGDLVIIEAGDQVPADLRLYEVNNLEINQAPLTGESNPTRKTTVVESEEKSILEANNLAFMGTSVVAGRGLGIVIATGINCQFGQIGELMSQEEEETPLEKRMQSLGRALIYISIVASLILFLAGILRGWPLHKISTLSIALLVSAVPESLPTIITLALAIGVIRMAKRKAIVRRLASVETLGVVQVIATDKTGTLTKNKLAVEEVVVSIDQDQRRVNFLPLKITGDQVLSDIEDQEVKGLLKTSLLCTDARIVDDKLQGDPIETAILEAAKKYQIDPILEKNRARRLHELPFDPQRGYMVTYHQVGKSRSKFLVIKGAFEKVLSFCNLTSNQRHHLTIEARRLSKEGMKVLAVAEKRASDLDELSLKKLDFMGLVAFADPPHDSAEESIRRSIKAGVIPKIITGDNELTATYIAKAVGMSVLPEEIMFGREVATLSMSELQRRVGEIKIFARATPKDKIRIVEALQKNRLIVAVTGDGVNDAPALRAADVGVAMGNGTEVAKEAADIVLLNNNYGTIIEAIRYGRGIYENIHKGIVFLLSGSFGELVIITLAIAVNLPVPITAIQILWINLVTDALPAMAFAFGAPDKSVLDQPPKNNREDTIASTLRYSALLMFLSLPAIIVVYYFYLLHQPELLSTAVVTAMVVNELIIALCVNAKETFWRQPLEFVKNHYLYLSILIVLLLHFAFVLTNYGRILGFVKISTIDLAIIGSGALLTFMLIEIAKSIRNYLKS